MLAVENIGEFDELMANCQSFLPQIYGIFNIRILLVGHSRQSFLLQVI